MAGSNYNNVITLGGLNTFLTKLKTECFYTRSALDVMLANYAAKNGNSAEQFSASTLKLYYDTNPLTVSVDTTLLTFAYDYETLHNEVTLNLSANGYILTSNDLDPGSKANLVNKFVFPSNNSVSSLRSFVSDPVISKFRQPILVQGISDDIEIYVDAGTVEHPTSFKAYNLGNPIGTVMYVGSSSLSAWQQAEGSTGMVSALPKGFYIVTKSVTGASVYKECEFLCRPSLYGLYYCISGGFFCHFDTVDGFETIATGGGGGGGTGDYTEATDEDINGLVYT